MSDLELRIAKLELKPGDVLVAKSDTRLTMEHARRLRDLLSQFFERILVIDSGIDLSMPIRLTHTPSTSRDRAR